MRCPSCAGMRACVPLSRAANLLGPNSAKQHFSSLQDTLPDLFLDWERSALIETVWSPKTGIVHAPYAHWRSGDHRPEGLLLAYGPGIPGATALPSIEVQDLAPSIAGQLGVSFGGTDGKALPWLGERG